MHGLFGEIQISEEPHERRQNSARFRSVKSLNGPAELFGHKRRHLRQISKRTGLEQLRSSLLTYNSTPAIALIEGLQRGVSIGPRKRRIAINPRIVGNSETWKPLAIGWGWKVQRVLGPIVRDPQTICA